MNDHSTILSDLEVRQYADRLQILQRAPQTQFEVPLVLRGAAGESVKGCDFDRIGSRMAAEVGLQPEGQGFAPEQGALLPLQVAVAFLEQPAHLDRGLDHVQLGTLLGMKHTGERTLSAFCFSVQDPSIREALKAYTVGGAMGQLLDAERDGLSFNRLTVFEIEDLMNLGEKYALPVLLYLFRRIERAIRGQPAAILLDEAWLMLGHPVFRDKLREWLKVMRKANCAVVLATQSLSDAARSGILDVLVESTATKIFLPNLHARDPDTAVLYARTQKMNEWYGHTDEASPFKRAETETVSIEIVSVIPQSETAWRIEWTETTRTRDGAIKSSPERMAALVTVYLIPATSSTTEAEIRKNPLGLYVKDYSWSRQS